MNEFYGCTDVPEQMEEDAAITYLQNPIASQVVTVVFESELQGFTNSHSLTLSECHHR